MGTRGIRRERGYVALRLVALILFLSISRELPPTITGLCIITCAATFCCSMGWERVYLRVKLPVLSVSVIALVRAARAWVQRQGVGGIGAPGFPTVDLWCRCWCLVGFREYSRLCLGAAGIYSRRMGLFYPRWQTLEAVGGGQPKRIKCSHNLRMTATRGQGKTRDE